jgi:tRNA threonylcarbamoyladenosine biosynthesis protein TsaB
MITLALDGSTYCGSVALLDGTRVLAEELVAMKGAEHERLMPAVAAVLERSRVEVSAVERVVCGAGPGSFTSLRIAGGIAKGIASGIGCPLHAVPSMALVIGGTTLRVGRYVVAMDALRGELYVGLYDVEPDDEIAEIEPARIIRAEAIDAVAHEFSAKVVSPSPLPDAIVSQPRAAAVARLEGFLQAHAPVDVRTWEPSYGRLAEAQVRWESLHGKPLTMG